MQVPDLRVKHAIAPIVLGRGKIHRARLVDLLLSHVSKKVIVIAAPAGYGKTTLLADFAAHAGIPTCWVRLQEDLDDAVSVARLLHSSLNMRFRRLNGSPKLSAFRGLSPEALARLIGDAVEMAIEKPFVIIIDDVQLANQSKEVIAFLDTLALSLPPHATILLAGREPPELSLARLMAEGNLAGLGPQDLALTRAELMSLLVGAAPAEQHEEMADRLLETTRGWITGVLLSRELARVSPTAPSLEQRPLVYEYLASVVLSRLPADLRRFMHESSVVRTMSVSSCDDVLGVKDSAAHLGQLARKGLFVTVSEDAPRSYEYHPLLRTLLLSELAASAPKRLAQLRLRAARRYEAEHSPEESFALYIDAGRPAQAKRIAEASAGEMFRTGRYKVLERWASQIRDSGLASIPLLRLVANTCVDRGRLDHAEALLVEIDQLAGRRLPYETRGAIENLRGVIALRRGNLKEAMSAVARGRRLLEHSKDAYLHIGMNKRLGALATASGGNDMRKAEALGSEAVKYLELARDDFSLAQVLIDLYGYQLLAGKPIDAWHSITRAQAILERLGSPLPLAVCSHNVALMLHQNGRIEEALLRFAEAVRLANRAGSPVREAQAMFSQADLFCDLRLYREAGELYERGLDLAATSGDLETLGVGCMRIGVLHRRAGNAALAEGWLTRAEEFGGRGTRLGLAISLQRAILRLGSRPHESVLLLAQLIAGKRGVLDVFDLALARFMLSYAYDKRGDRENAHLYLLEALTTAKATGAEQSIVGEVNCGDPIYDFVARMRGLTPDLLRIGERIQLIRDVARRFEEQPQREPKEGKLEVRGFGKSSIKYGSSELKGQKPLHRAILHYVVDRQRAERDLLAEEFWPDHPAGRQGANLHMAIYSLRKALGRENLVFDGQFYSLGDSLLVEYDVAQFERAASTALRLPPGDPRRYFGLTEAVNSYGGRFLEDADYTWCTSRRSSLEKLFLQVVDLYAEEAMRRGNTPGVIDILARALQIDPLRDGLNVKYIEALAMQGRRQEAVGHYARYARLLSEELGLDPSAEVRLAYARMIG